MKFVEYGCRMLEFVVVMVGYVGVNEEWMEASYLAAWCRENDFG